MKKPVAAASASLSAKNSNQHVHVASENRTHGQFPREAFPPGTEKLPC